MKRLNFWRTLFFSALAVTAFAACSDDDDDKGGSGSEPSITVDGKETATVAHDLTAGTTDAVEVVSTGAWELVSKTSGSETWCTPSANKGKAGTTQLTFDLAAADDSRSATFTLTTKGNFMGYPISKSATITVNQNKDGSTTTETNVAKVRALVKAMNLPITSTNDGAVEATEEIRALTLTGIVTSDPAGKNFGSNGMIALQDNDLSAKNSGLAVWIAASNSGKLVPGTMISFPLTTAKAQNYNGTLQLSMDADGLVITTVERDIELVAPAVSPADFADYQSQYVKVARAQTATVLDNKTYSEEYAAKFVTVDGQSFEVRTAKNANDTEYGKTVISNQSGPVFGMAQVYQKSADATPGIQISPRNAGDVAGLTEERFTIESTSGTIAEILEKGEGSYKIENATVVALTQRSFVAKDATGAILVYRGFDAEEKIGEGDVVTIDGLVERYSGMLQFAQSATVTVTSTGSVPAEQAIEVDASNIQSIIDAEKVVYVKIAGELIKDQTYYNLTFGFETNYGGSIDAPIESLGIDAFVGLPVEVEGWYTGMTKSSTLFTVVATKVAANTSEPFAKFDKESLTFAAEGAEPQTVGITSQNAAGLKFEIEGANKDKFFVKSYTDKTVEVEVDGDNTSDAAYKATLVAKLNDKTLASVALTQSAKATGDVSSIELDFSTSNYTIASSSNSTEQSFDTDGYTFKYRYLKYYEDYHYLMFDAKSNEGSYLTTPAVDGKKLVKVTVTNRKGASGTAKLAIYPLDTTEAVAGGEASVWPEDAQQTASDLTFNLTGTEAGTSYRIYAIKGKNAQAVKIVLEYE